MNAPAGVTIDRFLLRGDTGHRRELLESLDTQSWPGEGSEKIWIIRRIAVSGCWWELGAGAVEQARALLAGAVHGTDARAGDAGVVVFRNQAELTACLCADITAGRIGRWYWQSRPEIRLSAAEGMIRVLGGNWLDMPVVFRYLAAMKALAPVCRRLGAAGLAAVYSEVARCTGWVPQADVPAAAQSLLLGNWQVDQLRKFVSLWRPVFAQLNNESSMRRASALLLALLGAWQIAPHRLRDTHFSSAWLRVTSDIVDVEFQTAGITGQTQTISAHRTRPVIPEQASGRKQNVWAPAGPEPDHASRRFAEKREQADDRPLDLMGNAFYECPEEGSDAGYHFVTRSGGIFYLVNALRFADCVPLIENSGLSPWQWIYPLGKKLNGYLDAEILTFLAAEAGVEPVSELAEMALPQTFPRMLNNLQRRFPAKDLLREGLLPVPARVQLAGARIDVFFHLQSVRLDLRLAGMDVDPGWQPWLGRVLRFHYGEYPELLLLQSACPELFPESLSESECTPLTGGEVVSDE